MATLSAVPEQPECSQLADLSRILLNPARSKQSSEGASCRGYDFIAPLDADGDIDSHPGNTSRLVERTARMRSTQSCSRWV